MKFLDKSLTEVQTLIASKQVKAQDVVQESLNRIQELDKKLNSIVTLNERAMESAQKIDERLSQGEDVGPLAGIPISVKDMFCTKNLKTTACSKMLENFIPPYSATVIEKLEAAGAVIVGKTNCDEFAMGSSNETSIFGASRNPWDLERVAGGSSGGSAASVSGQLVFGSLGTDTGGSIRQPAALCGVYGIKPTYGRVSRYGAIAYASSLDQAGSFAKTTRDVAEILKVISGYDERDSISSREAVPDWTQNISTDLSQMTIGIPKEYLSEELNPDIQKTTKDAIEVLKSRGAKTKEVSLPHTQYAVPTYYLVANSEASSNLARYDGVRYGFRANSGDIHEMYSKTRGEGFGFEVKKRIMLGTLALSSSHYDGYYKKASQVRRLILEDFLRVFSECDAIVCPVTTSSAFKVGERIQDIVSMYYNDIFTTSVNLAGLPAMSVPAGLGSDGLPLGVQIIAPHFKEQTIFNFSQALEDNIEQRTPYGI